jgi:hypothetical protein
MEARYAVGDRVRVIDRLHSGHMRTPRYVRGKVGEVIRVVGPMLNPEQLAYGYSGVPGRMLYRVRFRQRDLWAGYAGGPRDTLEIELYEHWLAPSDETAGRTA